MARRLRRSSGRGGGGHGYAVYNPFTGSRNLGGSEGNQAFPGIYNAHDPSDLDVQQPFSNILNRMDPRDLATPSTVMDPRDFSTQSPFAAITDQMDPRDLSTRAPFQSMFNSHGGGGDQMANMGAFAQRRQRANMRARGYRVTAKPMLRKVSRPSLRPIAAHRKQVTTRGRQVLRRKVVRKVVRRKV